MPHTFLNPSVGIPLGNGVTLIIKLLALGQSQLKLHPAMLVEIHLERNQRHPFALNGTSELVDLLLVQQQFA